MAETPNGAPEKDPSPPPDALRIQDLLKTPWLGLRPDLLLHPGPMEFDGQRSWVLEDPLRGNHFKLGHAEGELVYRLLTEPTLDEAVRKLYATTTFRPTVPEILSFITRLQTERLTFLPSEQACRSCSDPKTAPTPSLIQQILQGNIIYRIPLLRPDGFLTRTLPWISLLWSPFLRLAYMLAGVIGLVLTVQELELYLKTGGYLFTPRGAAAFFICLAALKIGHEFAHAYTAKAMGLHVRSMGILFILIWPLLYTDTTDAWKIPDRKRRMKISIAGVLFEITVGGIAFLLWACSPDGITRSLMFFLSSTSLISSILINLNPLMRYDGYYLLMDLWGIDNLRPRALAMSRHALRRWLLGWTAPPPEIHPHRTAMILYGFCAMIYLFLISLSIAVAAYYLFFPVAGLTLFAVEVWFFMARPVWAEIRAIRADRRHMGSFWRLFITGAIALAGLALLILPLPRTERAPSLFLFQNATRIDAPSDGRLTVGPPREGSDIRSGELLAQIDSAGITHQVQSARFDLAHVQASIQGLGSGGDQGAYRAWLMAEEKRVTASYEKYLEASAQLEIRAPLTGRVVHVNQDLSPDAFVQKGTYLFTVADITAREVKAFVPERLISTLEKIEHDTAKIHFALPEAPVLDARMETISVFPVHRFPNSSLFDVAGGPVPTLQDAAGRRPRDAYFSFTFAVDNAPEWIPHGTPSWVWLTSERRSFLGHWLGRLFDNLMKRGLF